MPSFSVSIDYFLSKSQHLLQVNKIISSMSIQASLCQTIPVTWPKLTAKISKEVLPQQIPKFKGQIFQPAAFSLQCLSSPGPAHAKPISHLHIGSQCRHLIFLNSDSLPTLSWAPVGTEEVSQPHTGDQCIPYLPKAAVLCLSDHLAAS